MSSKISTWVGLIGIAATIPLVQTVAIAKTSVEVAEIAKTVTVSISHTNGFSSGVIIQHQGDVYTVLTTAHGVRKKSPLQTIASTKRSVTRFRLPLEISISRSSNLKQRLTTRSPNWATATSSKQGWMSMSPDLQLRIERLSHQY